MRSPGSFSIIDLGGWVAVAALTAGGYVAVAQPLVRSRIQTAGLLRTAEQTRQQVDEIRNQAAGLEREILKRDAEARDLAKHLRPIAQLNTRLEFVSNIAAKRDLKVLIMSPGAPVERQGYSTVPVKLGGLGTFVAAQAFIADLAAEMPDFAVERIELAGNADDPQREPRFELDLVWFAERPAQPAKSERPVPSGTPDRK